MHLVNDVEQLLSSSPHVRTTLGLSPFTNFIAETARRNCEPGGEAATLLLGRIKIGANVNISAGAIVVEDVAAGALYVDNKARQGGDARVSFANTETQK